MTKRLPAQTGRTDSIASAGMKVIGVALVAMMERKKMTEGMPPDQAFSVAISLALKILAAKALPYLALAMTFGLFSWAMATREWISLATAGTFALMVYLPCLFRTLSRPS